MEKELTERAQMQEELRASQARFAGILEIADDAVILVDKNQRVTLFNHAAERVFGCESRLHCRSARSHRTTA